MRKIFVILCVLSAVGACMPTPPSTTPVKKPHPLTAVWVDYAKKNPEVFNNEFSRAKAAPEANKLILDSLAKNPQLLYNCPMKFEMMLPLAKNKFVIKFSIMRHNLKDISYTENGTTYDVATDIFSIVDEDYAMSLKERQMYKLVNFTYEGDINKKNMRLPSGRKVEREPKIRILSAYHKDRYISLSGIYLSDIQLEEL
jgi:hypothetical protein